jgi:HSP20 family protein
MSTFHQIRRGFATAWDSLTEGWREFRELAGDALTRFQPATSQDGVETSEDRVVNRSSRWGLLAAEVADSDDSVEVRLEVPGLDANDIHLEVRDDILVIRGEKKLASERTRGRYLVMERAYGQFERAIRLPTAVDDDGANARYRAGVLTVTLPKSRTARPRRITVDS